MVHDVGKSGTPLFTTFGSTGSGETGSVLGRAGHLCGTRCVGVGLKVWSFVVQQVPRFLRTNYQYYSSEPHIRQTKAHGVLGRPTRGAWITSEEAMSLDRSFGS